MSRGTAGFPTKLPPPDPRCPARTREEEDPIGDQRNDTRMDCPECGDPVGRADQTCQKCGAPLSFAPDETGVHCAVCGDAIGAYTETCPACGETGYPALRPRRGRKWKGSRPEGLTRK